MSLLQLRASLALWRAKLNFRTRRWEYWRKRNNKPLIVKWEKLRTEAISKIHLREREIAARSGPVTMYDSVTVTAIPSNAKAAAGYANGIYANFPEVVKRTPGAKHVSITINVQGVADCLDVETGDATPGQAPIWVKREAGRLTRLGRHPIVYANASTMPSVKAALDGAKLPRDLYRLWIADYNGVAEVPAGYDAKQYEERKAQDVDLSVCNPSLFD